QLFKNYLNGTIPPSMGNMRSLYQLHLTSTSHPPHIHLSSTSHPPHIHLTATSHPPHSHLTATSREAYQIRSPSSLACANCECATFPSLQLLYQSKNPSYVSSNLLSGPFPPVLCNMTTLWELRISYNHFSGTVPECISNLKNAYYLQTRPYCSYSPGLMLPRAFLLGNGSIPFIKSPLPSCVLLPPRAPPPACSSPCVLLPLRAPPPACSSPCVLLPLRAPPPACSSPCVLLPLRAPPPACSSPYVLLPLRAPPPACSSPCVLLPLRAPPPAYIDTNWFTGTLPSTIGNLPLLQNLFINQNSLQGPLPATMTSLTSLRILSASRPPVPTLCPCCSLRPLPSLPTARHHHPPHQPPHPLHEQQPYLDGPLLSFMSSNPYLDGPLPSDLGNMVSLTDFVMEFAAFNGTMPDSITKLTRLSRMSVTPPSCPAKPPTCPLSLASPASHLMDNCRFTGSIPQGLSNLKALTVLYALASIDACSPCCTPLLQ
ncbi:unnamed protein product, partial [Closterium sp. Naga37s-1]